LEHKNTAEKKPGPSISGEDDASAQVKMMYTFLQKKKQASYVRRRDDASAQVMIIGTFLAYQKTQGLT
jgi:hypothetical protein